MTDVIIFHFGPIFVLLKKNIDVTGPVISGFANTDLGRKNEFQTKMGNFDAGVFFLIRHGESKQGVILTI